jgi:hypothetical protein
LSTVAIILCFNIILVMGDTITSIYELIKMVKEKGGVGKYIREKRLEMIKRIKNSAPVKLMMKKK